MYGIYIQARSPYYWIRYYDKSIKEPAQRRKSVPSEVKVTDGDWKRFHKYQEQKKAGIKTKPKYTYCEEIIEIAKGFRKEMNERDIFLKTGVRIVSRMKLSGGLEEFKRVKSVPGSKQELKQKTLENYSTAVDHFIKACGDKFISKYTVEDYHDLLYHFEDLKRSSNTRSIYTRALHTLWNFFIEKKHADINIIESTESEEKDPEPIPADDMIKIINELKTHEDCPHHYWIIYHMLLTGCRPSSAIVQLKDHIYFDQKKIKINNVKTGRRKKKTFYWFPLYKELHRFYCEDMKVKESNNDRLFWMYSVCPRNYTYPLSFWERTISKLMDEGIEKKLKPEERIRKRYTLKQIRPTFISFLVNVLKMDIYIVFKLADHADIKITDKYYIDLKLKMVRKDMDDIALEKFLEEELDEY